MAAARIAKHSVRILAVLALLACRGLSADVGASNALLRIAFGAGLDLNKPQPIWEAIAAAQPSLFILLGDVHPNIAGAAPTGSIFSACEGLRRIASLCPVMVIWSDRDLEPTADTTNVLDRTKLQTRFMDLLAEPLDSPRRNRPGVYDSRILGLIGRQTQIILLDTCSFRTPPVKQASPPPGDGPYEALDDRTATLLGSNQWTWLRQQLRTPAQLRIVASSIQVIAEDHHWQKWMNYPYQRRMLYDMIGDAEAEGVVFISGDRHHAELSVMKGPLTYSLYDLTSSGLDLGDGIAPAEFNDHRVSELYAGDNFGLITVDWNLPDPLVTLEVRDDHGKSQIRHETPLSLLHSPPPN